MLRVKVFTVFIAFVGLVIFGLNTLDKRADARYVVEKMATLPPPIHMQHDGHFYRWPKHTLSLYTADASKKNLIDPALRPWEISLETVYPLTIQWVDAPSMADILITFEPSLDQKIQVDAQHRRGYTAALTTPTRYETETGELKQITMRIATNNSGGLAQSPAVIQRVILHEFGHALGLFGHSANASDVMSPHYVKQVGASAQGLTLNAGDVQTIQTLYAMPEDKLLSTTPASFTLDRLKVQAESTPSWQNIWALARAYRNDNQLDLALTQYEKAFKLAQSNEEVLLEWLQTHQRENQNKEALAVLTNSRVAASAFTKPRIQLEKAWLQIKLNDKLAAKQSLDALRGQHPEYTKTPLYQQVFHQSL